jgi:hypothetical protein
MPRPASFAQKPCLFVCLVVSAVLSPAAGAQLADQVQFNAAYSQADLGWDSGYYPPGNPQPGGTFIQVRLKYAAAAAVNAEVAGEYEADAGMFGPAAANGSWDYDFGAEVVMEIAFNINFTIPNPLPWGDDFTIAPFVIEMPWVPNFDLRSTESTDFDTYLLDSTSHLGKTTAPVTVYDMDLVDLIAGAINMPSWAKALLNAGASLNVAIETNGDLSCDDMTLTNGSVFTEEGQRLPLGIPHGLFDHDATYNEHFVWDVTLHNTVTVFISFLGLARWELPVTEIPWNVYTGPLDLAFNQDQATFDLGSEGEGNPEGSGEGSIEGEPVCAVPACEAACPGQSLNAGFETALNLMYSGLDANPNLIDRDFNGITDLAHARLVDSILASPALAIHCCVYAAWQNNLPAAAGYADLVEAAAPEAFAEVSKTAFITALTGMMTIGDPSSGSSLVNLLPNPGSLPELDSVTWDLSAHDYLAALGFADTDPVCNLGEFRGSNGAADFNAFVIAALDPLVIAEGSGCPCLLEVEGELEGEGMHEGEGIAEGQPEGIAEGEGTPEGQPEGVVEGEGAPEGQSEGIVEGEGAPEGQPEGVVEGEGTPEGQPEGIVEGEGTPEGQPEGIVEGEGLAEGEGSAATYSADQDDDGAINLTELLRVIQFFNIRGYYCPDAGVTTEDGYLPGAGENHSCAPHASDYSPQDWQINLTELLRLIQFFNIGGYHACPEAGTEDGYCPGTA